MRRFVTALFQADETVPHWGRRYSDAWISALESGLEDHCRGSFHLRVLKSPYVGREYCQLGFAGQSYSMAEPFQLSARGWAKLLERFRPDVVGDRALVLDLDTVIVGDIGKLLDIDAELLCLRDPYQPEKLCSGVFVVDGKLAAEVWERWRDTWQDEIESGRYAVRGLPFCDQEWMRKNLADRVTFLDDVMPGAVLTYKRDVEGKLAEKPEGCLAVAYHGRPKPDEELPEAWACEGWA